MLAQTTEPRTDSLLFYNFKHLSSVISEKHQIVSVVEVI